MMGWVALGISAGRAPVADITEGGGLYENLR